MNDNKVIIFHHNDMDGIVSARIILNHLRAQKIPFKNEDFIEMDYNKKFGIIPQTIKKPIENNLL